MALSAGRLRHRITLLRPVETETPSGVRTDYVPAGPPIAAEVKGIRGSEQQVEHVLQGIRAYRITIRWRGDVLTSWQIRHDGQDLNIRAADDPTARREELVILADNQATIGS